jgi:hypothetical protein
MYGIVKRRSSKPTPSPYLSHARDEFTDDYSTPKKANEYTHMYTVQYATKSKGSITEQEKQNVGIPHRHRYVFTVLYFRRCRADIGIRMVK